MKYWVSVLELIQSLNSIWYLFTVLKIALDQIDFSAGLRATGGFKSKLTSKDLNFLGFGQVYHILFASNIGSLGA